MYTLADLVISLDIENARVGLMRLSKRMDTIGGRILPGVAKVMAATVDKGFLEHGVPVPWKPLADSTIKKRRQERARGKRFVAGDEDQLRVSDNLRSAATDTSGLLNGSAYKLDTGKDIVQIGVDSSELPYALTQQRGNPVRNIPARPYMVITDETEKNAQEFGQKQINLLAADWEAGRF